MTGQNTYKVSAISLYPLDVFAYQFKYPFTFP